MILPFVRKLEFSLGFIDQIFEQLVKGTSKLEENKIENIFQQFEKLSLGEKPKTSVEYKINPFEPRNLEIKPWKL